MDAPTSVLWLLSGLFVAMAVPCVSRLVLDAGPAGAAAPEGPVAPQDECCRVSRLDEAVELLMGLGMLAMVSPVGGPVPLAGWQALFAVAAVGLGALWLLRRRLQLRATRCGHHAVMAAAMLYMLAAMTHGHTADPWLTMAGHTGALPFWPLAAAVLAYTAADAAVNFVRAARASAGYGVNGARARAVTRMAGSAAMGGMIAAML